MMWKIAWRGLRGAFLVGLALGAFACGGNGPASQPVSISISPTAAAVTVGQTFQFTATIGGSGINSVIWSVNGVPGGTPATGTISSSGLYTSPAEGPVQTDTVTAMSAVDTSQKASATITVVEPGAVAATANPQVAEYSISLPRDATVSVEFGPDTNYGRSTWAVPTPSGGGKVDLLVAGMKAFATYHLRADVQFSDGTPLFDADHAFTTGGLPADRLPNISVAVPPGPATNPGVELLALSKSSANQIQAAATDLDGSVIWYYDFSGTPNLQQDLPFPVKLLPNGDMKIVIASAVSVTSTNTVREIDLAGNTVSELTNADLNARLAKAGFGLESSGFHHDFAALPNGHTIYLIQDRRDVVLSGQTAPTAVIGDALVDIDPDGNPVRTWSTFDHLDPNYHPFQFPDWTHCNALVYIPDDGSLLLSSRGLSWIMKIDYGNGTGTGDILWRLGPNGDFTLQNGGPSDWFYNQHYPNFLGFVPGSTTNFNLAVWDNGNSRPDPTTGVPCGNGGVTTGLGPCYSRGVILNVDEDAKTAAIAFQDNLSPYFAICCGNIGILSNNNVELGGGASVDFASTQALEVTQETVPEVVWQMNITGQIAYRSFRIPSLYPGVQW